MVKFSAFMKTKAWIELPDKGRFTYRQLKHVFPELSLYVLRNLGRVLMNDGLVRKVGVKRKGNGNDMSLYEKVPLDEMFYIRRAVVRRFLTLQHKARNHQSRINMPVSL